MLTFLPRISPIGRSFSPIIGFRFARAYACHDFGKLALKPMFNNK
jgi:hypothetical protein